MRLGYGICQYKGGEMYTTHVTAYSANGSCELRDSVSSTSFEGASAKTSLFIHQIIYNWFSLRTTTDAVKNQRRVILFPSDATND